MQPSESLYLTCSKSLDPYESLALQILLAWTANHARSGIGLGCGCTPTNSQENVRPNKHNGN